MPGCEFKAFKAANSKVKLLCFHPVQPWLAFADKGQVLLVMDWNTQQLLFEAPVGATEEVTAIDTALQRLAERDPSYYGPPGSSLGSSSRPSAPGSIKDMCFMDVDTCFWQLARHKMWQMGCHGSSSIPAIGRARRLKSHRWLVAACDTKILLQDLTSSSSIEVPRALCESKAPTCLAVIYLNGSTLVAGDGEVEDQETVVSPVIAAGTSSGIIYLISIKQQECVLCARLVGGHKAGVTKLLTIAGKEPGSPERLVSAASDGSVAVWDPSANVTAASKDIGASATAKPHDGEVLSMVFACAAGDAPGYAIPRLVTSGDDKRVAVLDLPTLSRQIARWKPLSRGTVDSLAYNPWAPQNLQLVAISGDRAAVWSLPSDGRLIEGTPLISLDNFLPVGTKKAAKVYTIAVHPLQPGIVAIGCNTGVGLLITSTTATAPAAALPLDFASPAGLEAVSGATSTPFDYLYASETTLWKLSSRATWSLDASSRQLTVQSISKSSIMKLPARGTPEVLVSADGQHCSMVWPETSQFVILSCSGSDIWQEVKAGSGSAVAWAPNGRLFAVLHLPQVTYPEVRRGKTKKSKAREEEAAAQAAAHAASLSAQESGHVKVYSISGSGTILEQSSAAMRLPPSAKPLGLFGGPVLGVTTNRSVTRGLRRGNSMQFFSWVNGSPVGPEMLSPTWLAWEPQVTAVALGYPHAVVLYRTQPQVHPIATLPIKDSASASWHHKMLLIASPCEIHGVFVAAGAHMLSPFVESVKLASMAGGIVSQLASAGDGTAPRPSEGMRCAGPCTLAGVRDGVLWLVDTRGQPFAIPLDHARLRARVSACMGDVKSARAVAEIGLRRAHHDEIALFLNAMVPEAGLDEALALSGISLGVELKLSQKAGKFRRALRCLQALALGANDSAAFREFPSWAAHLSESTPLETAPAPREAAPLPFAHLIQHMRAKSTEAPQEKKEPRRSLLDFIAADNVDEESSEDEELEEQADAMMGIAQAPSEAIDWDALLLTTPMPTEPQGTRADEGLDAEKEVAGLENGHSISAAGPLESEDEQKQNQDAAVSREEEMRTASLVEDGLQLADLALAAGQIDVAVAALRTLLRGAPQLQPQQLQALLVRCAACGMRSEIRSFASRIITDGTGASPETAALVAALLDDSSLAHNALRASGMIPLAAIYSQTWKHGNPLQDINDWAKYLTAAAGNGVQFAVTPPTN